MGTDTLEADMEALSGSRSRPMVSGKRQEARAPQPLITRSVPSSSGSDSGSGRVRVGVRVGVRVRE